MKPRFRRLRADDNLSGFDCGVDSLNSWVSNHANFAFRETENNPSRLWLPLSTIRSLVAA